MQHVNRRQSHHQLESPCTPCSCLSKRRCCLSPLLHHHCNNTSNRQQRVNLMCHNNNKQQNTTKHTWKGLMGGICSPFFVYGPLVGGCQEGCAYTRLPYWSVGHQIDQHWGCHKLCVSCWLLRGERSDGVGNEWEYSLCIKNKFTLAPAELLPSWPGLV